ncbi:hypothetical protein PUNSTDRAFT_126394 [Punctularia strigosozonata HHB-11173 SS5]|uniref:uncharacterized protein n=1 Tax=Punctularia strigosozonata (strain HHB-11173) TaxID=741275 RepID=UPI00044163E9|nr:uncharacterized protein PUNSTDRAFT_126394 [Punctularia strigosozonata HHB-11173 SS5]EIN08300.1 hypothetical protein PUNSTDRAFT_126394 [Punctularia strigosozonata HHB-11173 SS5]
MPIYDQHPVYPHQAHLRFAYEPFKSIYVWWRLLTTLIVTGLWTVYYTFMPRRFRPRPSWSLLQIIIVKFYRRIFKVTEVAGVTWGTRDPQAECDNRTLRETRFEWVPALPEELRTGVLVDEKVSFQKVGTFIWPKSAPCIVGDSSYRDSESSNGKQSAESANTQVQNKPSVADVDAEQTVGAPKVIGVFMHGGGYTQMSAHEKAGTSRIPRRLVEDKTFTEIHAVEYRLLQHGPCPAALQDAAAVYSHLVRFHPGLRAVKGEDGVWRYPHDPPSAKSHPSRKHNIPGMETDDSDESPWSSPEGTPMTGYKIPSGLGHEIPNEGPSTTTEYANVSETGVPLHINAEGQPVRSPLPNTNSVNGAGGKAMRDGNSPQGGRQTKIVLIGDSAGGNLVLGLARWIRDEGVLPMPDGLLLLSPSCDPSHAFPLTPSSYIPRPHASTDYLVDNPEPRALLQKTFLGHHPLETIHSPYLSPASPRVLRAYGHPVTHAGTNADHHSTYPPPSGSHLSHADDTARGSRRRHDGGTAEIPGTDKSLHRNGEHIGAGAIAAASASVLAIAEPNPEHTLDLTLMPEPDPEAPRRSPRVTHKLTELDRSVQRPVLQSTQTFLNPKPRDPALRTSLFGGFSKSFVTVGDAERLEREIVILVNAMKRDGVDVHVQWAKDAVHDMLMLPLWDEQIREATWQAIQKWIAEL